MHAALLIDQRLQEFQFGFVELRLYACCPHALYVTCPRCYFEAAATRAFTPVAG
jgi:hypothetical protein